MKRKLHSIMFALAAALLILAPAPGKADVTDGYCASYDGGSNNFHIPCLIYGNSTYSVDLSVVSSTPPTLTVSAIGASSLAPTLGKCATFNASNSTVSIPCVVLGETRYWADFSVGPNAATLLKNNAGIPRSCIPLTQVPNGVTVDISAKGEVTGNVAEAVVRNGTNQELCFCAMPCMSLANSSADAQNLAVVKTGLLCLGPSQTGTMQLQGSCINQSKHAPSMGQSMALYAESRNDLCSLSQAIDRELQIGEQFTPDMFIAMQAVWAITDNAPPLDTNSVALIKQLFRQAGLNPDNYLAFSGSGMNPMNVLEAGPLLKLRKFP